jgi:hypothetical protein
MPDAEMMIDGEWFVQPHGLLGAVRCVQVGQVHQARGKVRAKVQSHTVAAVDVQCGQGHRVVDVYRYRRDGAGGGELAERVEHQLGAIHGEGGDQDGAASLHGATDGFGQDLVGGAVIGWMGAVTVGRLDDDRAGGGRCLPGQEQRVTRSTEVTGEQNRACADRDQGAGRSQDVTCPAEGQMRTRAKITVLVVVQRFERGDRLLGVGGVVQRAWRVVPREPPESGILSVLLL